MCVNGGGVTVDVCECGGGWLSMCVNGGGGGCRCV